MNGFSAVYDKLLSGTAGNWLAIIGVLSLIYWAWRIIDALQHGDRHRPHSSHETTPERPVAREATGEPPNQDIAVIAAAVYAMLGATRVVHLEASRAGESWAIEGRWMQQTSHQPR